MTRHKLEREPRQRGARTKRRWLPVLLAGLLTTVLALPTAASAAAPTREYFDDSFTDPNMAECAAWGFTVNLTAHIYGTTQTFTDNEGNVVKRLVHLNFDITFAANGITLIERDTWTQIWNADGVREAGLWAHIQGPRGLVLRDAGQLVWDSSGHLLYMRGPHDQFNGQSFCPALVP